MPKPRNRQLKRTFQAVSTWEQVQCAIVAGRKWARTANPLDVHLLWLTMGEAWRVRERDLVDDFPKQLRELMLYLAQRGVDYLHAFIHGAYLEFATRRACLVANHHVRGNTDGSTWASDLASPKQLASLRKMSVKARGTVSWIMPAWLPNDDCTPALVLLEWIFGKEYPRTNDGRPTEDCELFREFWQPFTAVPMSEVVDEITNPMEDGRRHLVQSPDYIDGFVNGALGLAESLRGDLIAAAAQLSA